MILISFSKVKIYAKIRLFLRFLVAKQRFKIFFLDFTKTKRRFRKLKWRFILIKQGWYCL